MKLSEAIRLGSMLGPQLRGEFQKKDDKDGAEASCAMGAAFLAIGTPCHTEISEEGGFSRGIRGFGFIFPGSRITVLEEPEEWKEWKWLYRKDSQPQICPICLCELSGMQFLPHLNDDHELTREEIADIIEGLEKENEKAELTRKLVAEAVEKVTAYGEPLLGRG